MQHVLEAVTALWNHQQSYFSLASILCLFILLEILAEAKIKICPYGVKQFADLEFAFGVDGWFANCRNKMDLSALNLKFMWSNKRISAT